MIFKIIGLFFIILAGFSVYDILFFTKDYFYLIVSFILLLIAFRLFRSK